LISASPSARASVGSIFDSLILATRAKWLILLGRVPAFPIVVVPISTGRLLANLRL
jgi:hypothetical protein